MTSPTPAVGLNELLGANRLTLFLMSIVRISDGIVIPVLMQGKPFTGKAGSNFPAHAALGTNAASSKRIPNVTATAHSPGAEPTAIGPWSPLAFWTVDIRLFHWRLTPELTRRRPR
jgi:hypothetical protein